MPNKAELTSVLGSSDAVLSLTDAFNYEICVFGATPIAIADDHLISNALLSLVERAIHALLGEIVFLRFDKRVLSIVAEGALVELEDLCINFSVSALSEIGVNLEAELLPFITTGSLGRLHYIKIWYVECTQFAGHTKDVDLLKLELECIIIKVEFESKEQVAFQFKGHRFKLNLQLCLIKLIYD